MASQKKIMYWHPIARGLIEMGLMPKEINKVFGEIFPKNAIGTRKIGAYKRRIVDEGTEIVPTNDRISMESAIVWAKEALDEAKLRIEKIIGRI